ncbi:hypothetical protein JYT11_00555 [Planctomycetaceae bacterium AH-315-I19]|nr:hypothetical protein [Planctomycetaceae bacterium AH-315-I19]
MARRAKNIDADDLYRLQATGRSIIRIVNIWCAVWFAQFLIGRNLPAILANSMLVQLLLIIGLSSYGSMQRSKFSRFLLIYAKEYGFVVCPDCFYPPLKSVYQTFRCTECGNRWRAQEVSDFIKAAGRKRKPKPVNEP